MATGCAGPRAEYRLPAVVVVHPVSWRSVVAATAWLARAGAAAALLGAALFGQNGAEAGDPVAAQRDQMVRRLRRLDLPYTDWTLLRGVSEKLAPAGESAQPVVAVEVELARTNPDPRYRVRLLGAQVVVEPQAALAELERLVAGEDAALAQFAARVLGRCGAPRDRLATLVADRIARETRAAVRAALVLAAGDAGATAVAPLLRTLLEKGAVVGPEVTWTWTALAQTAAPESLPQAQLWLVPHSQFLGAAVLMARRFLDADAERPLCRLLEVERDEPIATWIAQSLGACGGDAARKALRASIEADQDKRSGVLVVTALVDPRQLALLRLGDKAARALVEGLIGRSATMLESGVARTPELFGRWQIDGAAALLAQWIAKKELPPIVRASAARGLCWLGGKDGRQGLQAATELMLEDGLDAHAPAVVEAWLLAQRTLHEFVADLDRPDYQGFVPGDERKVVEVGRQWRAWLRERELNLAWRRPPEDPDDLRCWY